MSWLTQFSDFLRMNPIWILVGLAGLLLAITYLGPPLPPPRPQVVTLSPEDRKLIVEAVASGLARADAQAPKCTPEIK